MQTLSAESSSPHRQQFCIAEGWVSRTTSAQPTQHVVNKTDFPAVKIQRLASLPPLQMMSNTQLSPCPPGAPRVLTFRSRQNASVRARFPMLAPAQQRIAGRSGAGRETDRAAVLSPQMEWRLMTVNLGGARLSSSTGVALTAASVLLSSITSSSAHGDYTFNRSPSARFITSTLHLHLFFYASPTCIGHLEMMNNNTIPTSNESFISSCFCLLSFFFHFSYFGLFLQFLACPPLTSQNTCFPSLVNSFSLPSIPHIHICFSFLFCHTQRNVFCLSGCLS